MEAFGIFLLIGLVVLVFVLPIRAFIVSNAARARADELEDRWRDWLRRAGEQYDRLARRVSELEAMLMAQDRPGPAPAPEAALHPVLAPPPAAEPPAPAAEPVAETGALAPPPPPLPEVMPAPLPHAAPLPPPLPVQAGLPALAPVKASGLPPALAPARPAFTLEQFMGVKLFAWLGGLALFLGIVFFVKYAFERDLISPATRTAIGFMLGLGLTVAGLRLNVKAAYQVLAQTLCGTGVLVLYGVTFAAHALYHFPFFTTLSTFALMALITVTAFLLAVRMNAVAVAVLGMVGGFLTPLLVSTGQDNPGGLFGYITLLDVGLMAVAWRRRWFFLVALGAVGTLLMQIGWLAAFFNKEGYAHGDKTWVVVAVYLWFAFLFSAGAWWARRRGGESLFPAGSAVAMAAGAFFASAVFLGTPSIAVRPLLMYGFVLLINVTVLWTVWQDRRVQAAQVAAGGLTFAHLAVWTMQHLTPPLLPQALGIYLGFGLLHTAFSVLWQRKHPGSSAVIPGFMPVISLVLLLLPVLRLEEVSLWIWPAILFVDLLVIGLALATRALLPVLAALVLTLVTAFGWLHRLPMTEASLPAFLGVLCVFAMVFAVGSCVLSRRALAGSGGALQDRSALPDSLAQWLPVSSAVLPFVLLIMATVQIPAHHPAPIFGVALLLTLFLLGLTRFSGVATLPPAALAWVLAVQYVWQGHWFLPGSPVQPLLWHLGFFAVFALYPFFFRRTFERATLPWGTAALAGVGTFGLVHQVVIRSWPNEMMGLLPAAFALPPLLSLFFILKKHAVDNPARLTQLAWFGGVALFFITLVFPLQFERQWVTLGWALEGAALCWLFRRVPHNGLRVAGAVLLVVSFIRLALNPAVLTYQERSGTPVLNWYLYGYGVAAAAQIMAAWWLSPPRHRLADINLRALFSTLGGILLFLLVNIEIADCFTPEGSRFVTFQFGGHFARDMTYTIAWGLFALVLLCLGLWLRTPATRYAGIGLLGVTLVKLFLHDLDNTGSIYRIGALICVALIALAASFLYQRFFDRSHPEEKP